MNGSSPIVSPTPSFNSPEDRSPVQSLTGDALVAQLAASAAGLASLEAALDEAEAETNSAAGGARRAAADAARRSSGAPPPVLCPTHCPRPPTRRPAARRTPLAQLPAHRLTWSPLPPTHPPNPPCPHPQPKCCASPWR